MDDDNEGNADGNAPLEEDGAIRRNQVLIFGVVLLGILAICLAVSMPSDLEFTESELPTSAGSINMASEPSDRSPLPSVDANNKGNQTNSSASRKKALRSPDVSVEVQLLRDMAIQKKIQEYDTRSSAYDDDQEDANADETYHASQNKEELETVKVNNIVETFIQSDDFEDFLIDMEIHDAVKKLREEKGYKSRPTTLFDELFKRAEKEFIGEDEEELRLIRRVGDELEKRARDIIAERKKTRGEELTEPEKMLADELLKLDFSGSSGGDVSEEEGDDVQSGESYVSSSDSNLQVMKTEL